MVLWAGLAASNSMAVSAPLSEPFTVKPTTLNLLLTSDNDIGTLNSEFFARYWIKPAWAIKAGYTFLFTEFTTNRELTFNNDRFRNKAGMFMVGITYAPFKK